MDSKKPTNTRTRQPQTSSGVESVAAASTDTVGASTPSSEGQRLLLETGASVRTIAAVVGCSKSLADCWRRGTKLPSEALRARLRDVYGIPPEAWEQAVGGSAVHSSNSGPDVVDDVPLEDPAEVDTLALTNARIAALQRDLRRTDLSEAVRSKKEDTFTRLLRLKDQLEEKSDPHRIVRDMPAWKFLRAELKRALEPYPEAAQAVSDALRRLRLSA